MISVMGIYKTNFIYAANLNSIEAIWRLSIIVWKSYKKNMKKKPQNSKHFLEIILTETLKIKKKKFWIYG